ncbi:MAG TPA: peptidylprolyl isomerase [Bdellovibrio sp.]|nr:peptidylprolyl isomerase [Bdellovibrio sp.]
MKKIKVSHILLEREYEAQDVLRALNSGKSSFEDLARKFSKCSSAKVGGDLGEVSVSRLDEDFVDAALALKSGEISEKPVRTKFGYHLIKRN